MKQIADQTRCEKCAMVLSTRHEENGVMSNVFHQGLMITVTDQAQNRFELCCPNCEHRMDCSLTLYPELGRREL